MTRPVPPLFTGSEIVGQECDQCTLAFRAGDVIRVLVIGPALDDASGCMEAVLVHHNCADPRADRLVH
jgi:hypothetical protein